MTIRKTAAYLKDYEVKTTDKGKKSLVYRGDIYQCNASDSQWKAYKRLNLSLVCLYILLWCIATLSDPTSLRGAGTVYVIIPYALVCFPILVAFGRVIHMQKLSQNMERMDYDQCFTSLSLCTMVIIGLGLATAIGQTVHIFLQNAFSFSEWVTALCFLIISVFAFAAYRLQNRYECQNIGKSPSNSNK